MSQWQRQLTEFHRATDSTVGDTPALRDVDLRLKLIREEVAELIEAAEAGDLPAAIKELCDVLYVTIGTGVAWGIDLDLFFDAVHESNMSKLPLTKREDGKVLKGPNYRPPDIEALLAGPTRECLACGYTLPVSAFSWGGRSRICWDCRDSGRDTPAIRRLARRMSRAESARRSRKRPYTDAA